MEITKKIVKTNAGDDLTVAVKSSILNTKNRPLIVTLHAFTGKKENRTIYEIFNKAETFGFNSACFDFSGHGESTGEITKCSVSKQITELNTVLKTLGDHKFILVGNSFSVVTAAAFAKSNPDKVSALIIISGRAFQEVNANYLGEHKEILPGKFIDDEFIADYLNHDTLTALHQIRCPVLIIHGSKDEIIPVSDATLLFQAASSKKKEIFILEQGQHRFDDSCREAAVNKIFTFLEHYL